MGKKFAMSASKEITVRPGATLFWEEDQRMVSEKDKKEKTEK